MAIKTFGKLDYNGESFIMDKVAPHVCLKLKLIFPFIKKSQTAPFSFPIRNEICRDLLWFCDRYPMEMGEGTLEALTAGDLRHKESQNLLVDIFKDDYEFRPVKFKEGYSLRKYQSQFVNMFDISKKMVLGDDVGLGKTVQVIGSILSGEKRPALIVVQTHLVDQWLESIRDFTDLKAIKFDGRKPFKLPEADVYVTKYVALQYWVDVLANIPFKAVYFDEIQELRKSESGKYQAAKNISRDVEYIAGATATPVYNYADEVWNIFDIVKSGCLGSYYDFMREWCSDGNWVKDPVALGSYLRSENLFLRRTASEVGRQLPVLNKIIHKVDYDEKAVADYHALAKTLAIKATTGSFTDRGQAYRELDIMVRQTTGISKAKHVAEYAKILLKNGEPILIAAWHREVYRILMEELAEFYPVLYTGSETPAQKEKAKKAFVNGDTNCFIISLRSGVGLDGLQHRCKYVLFAELDWSPAIHHQVTGRVNRDGQQHQVTAIYLVSDFGSDPLMVSLNGAKSSHATQITDPLTGGVVEQISDDSRLKLLAEAILKGG